MSRTQNCNRFGSIPKANVQCPQIGSFVGRQRAFGREFDESITIGDVTVSQ
jgi:hypothetical protein